MSERDDERKSRTVRKTQKFRNTFFVTQSGDTALYIRILGGERYIRS